MSATEVRAQSFRLRRFGILTLIALSIVASASFAQTTADDPFPGELLSVSGVKLQGRRHVPAKELWPVIKTKRPSRLPWAERPVLRRDFLVSDAQSIELVYRQFGFLEVRVAWRVGEPRNGAVKVVFDIDEGPRSRISRVDFTGVTSFTDRELKRRLYARAGRPFNPSFLIADTSRISDAYKERGFLPVVRAAFRRDSLDVVVRYEVDEGPLYRFGAVYFSSPGESKVREELVRRELLIREGEVFRATRVQRSIERLYETGLFRQVQMLPLPDSTHRRIEFDLRVRERSSRWIDAGVGSGTQERFRVTGEWGHRNIAGQGLQGVLSGRVAFDEDGRFLLGRGNASLLEPWLAGTRTRGQVTLYLESLRDRANTLWTFESEARGVTFELRREINRWAQVSLTQDNAFIRQDYAFDEALSQARRDSLLGAIELSYSTHRFQLAGDRDSRDDFLRPSRGSLQHLLGEVAVGASKFTKWEAGASWYTPVRGRWVLATRTRAGVVNPFGIANLFSPDDPADLDGDVRRVPLVDRFRIGGVNSLRGHEENLIPVHGSGGLAVIQANAELRIPLVGPLGFEMFLDAGNVWARAAYIKMDHFVPEVSDTFYEPGDVRYVYGLGARLDLPFGPLRLDFAWSLRPDVVKLDADGNPSKHFKQGGWQIGLGPTF